MVLSTAQFFKQFLLIVTVIFGVHFLLHRAFDSFFGYNFNTLIEIYAFLIVLSVAHFFALQWLFKKWPKYSGFIFTGLSLLKMAVCVLYLFPSIYPANEQSIPVALSFMTIYMFLLAFEVVFIAKSLNKNH